MGQFLALVIYAIAIFVAASTTTYALKRFGFDNMEWKYWAITAVVAFSFTIALGKAGLFPKF